MSNKAAKGHWDQMAKCFILRHCPRKTEDNWKYIPKVLEVIDALSNIMSRSVF